MAKISVSHLTFCYEGSFDNIFTDVSFNIDSDWKLGLIGRNGRGKTTFLNLLMGNEKYQGTIVCSQDFDYFPFDIEDTSQHTIDVIHQIKPTFELWQLMRELTLLKVKQHMLYQSYDSLSMGEQTKVMLAVLFMRDNNFLLIDEPTNHLDMHARMLVSQYLNLKKGFILVSHDKHFLDNCTNHMLSINKSDITVHKGDFSTWYENKKRQDNFELDQNIKLKKEITRLTKAAKQTTDWSDKVEATKWGEDSYDKGHMGHMAAKMMQRSKTAQVRRQHAIDEKSKLLKNIETADNLKIHPLWFHSDPLIRMNDLSISYGDNTIFSDKSF